MAGVDYGCSGRTVLCNAVTVFGAVPNMYHNKQ